MPKDSWTDGQPMKMTPGPDRGTVPGLPYQLMPPETTRTENRGSEELPQATSEKQVLEAGGVLPKVRH